MSIPWGPALEAELAYRHAQARQDFRRRTWRRKPAKALLAEVVAQHFPAQHVPAQHVSAQHIPAQRGPVPLIPILPRPIDQVTVPLEPTQPADAKVNQDQPSAHAA